MSPFALRRQADEDRFVELQDEYESATNPASRKQAEKRILQLVEENFRRELRPLLVQRLGLRIAPDGESRDASVRYTTLVNDFFLKVLDKRPDDFWKRQTLHNLRKWASVTLTRQFIDHLRRRNRGTEAARVYAQLAEQRRVHFEKHYKVPFLNALERLEAWRSGDDDHRRTMADLMLRHYVDGYPWKQLEEQFNLTAQRIEYLRKKAIELLSK